LKDAGHARHKALRLGARKVEHHGRLRCRRHDDCCCGGGLRENEKRGSAGAATALSFSGSKERCKKSKLARSNTTKKQTSDAKQGMQQDQSDNSKKKEGASTIKIKSTNPWNPFLAIILGVSDLIQNRTLCSFYLRLNCPVVVADMRKNEPPRSKDFSPTDCCCRAQNTHFLPLLPAPLREEWKEVQLATIIHLSIYLLLLVRTSPPC